MTGWELPNRVGPWVCLANGVVAVAVVGFLVASLPTLGPGETVVDHPWLGHWMRGTAVVALLMPASTLLLWRDCPVLPLPPSQWPRGEATPLRLRVRRGAPRGAKPALVGLVVHGLGLLALPFVALAAGGAF